MLISSSSVLQNASVLNQNEIKKSLNKLSTGLRINKASDDASGLAIADKLRTQASGIKQGIDNANSATALLQITDKSIDEISNIIDIVKSKLIQAHTHTTSDDGRKAIKKNIEKLLTQIESIANQTNYNNLSLLSHEGLEFQIGANSNDIISLNNIDITLKNLGKEITKTTTTEDTETTTITDDKSSSIAPMYKDTNFTTGYITSDFNKSYTMSDFSDPHFPLDEDNIKNEDIIENQFGVHPSMGHLGMLDVSVRINPSEFQSKDDGRWYSSVGTGTYFPSDQATKKYFESFYKYFVDKTGGSGPYTEGVGGVGGFYRFESPTLGVYYKINGFGIKDDAPELLLKEQTLNFKATHYTHNDFIDESIMTPTFNNVILNSLSSKKLQPEYNSSNIAIGFIDDPKIGNDYSVNQGGKYKKIVDSSAESDDSSGIDKTTDSSYQTCGTLEDLKKMPIDSFTFKCAGEFQEVTDTALTVLNKYRAEVGSTQNQIEFATRNLMTNYTNIKDAESIIRDVDYAKESANFSKLNIIAQAGNYALSQANTNQENVIKLLK